MAGFHRSRGFPRLPDSNRPDDISLEAISSMLAFWLSIEVFLAVGFVDLNRHDEPAATRIQKTVSLTLQAVTGLEMLIIGVVIRFS